jgi:hypothetical protein
MRSCTGVGKVYCLVQKELHSNYIVLLATSTVVEDETTGAAGALYELQPQRWLRPRFGYRVDYWE